MLNIKSRFFVWIILIFSGCASLRTNTEFYNNILPDLQNGNFNSAAEKIKAAELDEEYADKDRVLLYLDKGIINHYQDNFQGSNKELEMAELSIEELYTKSIREKIASSILNDNS